MRIRFVVALLSVVACSRFSPGDTAAPSVPAEADAGTDASLPTVADSGPSNDAGADAGPTLPLGAFDPIAQTSYAKFQDFDTSDIDDGPFEWDAQGGDGNSDPSDDCAKGEPNCSPTGVVRLHGGQGGSPMQGGFLESDLDDSQIFRFDFSLKFDAPNVVNATQLVTIELEEGERYLYVDHYQGKLRIGDQRHDPNGDENAYSSDQIVVDDTPLGWNRFRLYVNLRDHLLGLAKNGVPYVAWRIRDEILKDPVDSPKLRIGVTYQQGASAFILYFDDVGLKSLE